MSTVSIILPIHNAAPYLARCLDAVILQTFKDMEIICVDDGSTDESADIIRRYQARDPRIRLISGEHHGAGAARNLGLAQARGEYVLFLDADDFFEINLIEKLYAQSLKTNADVTFCGFHLFDDVSCEVKKIDWDINRDLLPQQNVFSLKKGKAELLVLISSVVWNQLYRRDFLLKNKLKFQNIKSFNDVLFGKAALLLADRISYVNEKLIYYRINNENSLSHHQSILDAIRAIYALNHFLTDKKLLKKYKNSFFQVALALMNRSLHTPEPYCSFLRSFYRRRLIPKFWGEEKIPDTFSLLKKCNTITPTFQNLFFNKREHILPIVMATEKKEYDKVAIAIEAIKQTRGKRPFYDVFILHEDLPTVTQFNLSGLSESGIRVSCISVSQIVKKYFKQHHIHPCLYLFAIPELLKGYDKVLWLTPDLLVQNDLKKLFDIDLRDKAVAGFPINADEEYNRNVLNLSSHNMLNSDILVLNIPICQNLKLMKKICNNISFFKQLQDINDVQNILFQGKQMLFTWDLKEFFDKEWDFSSKRYWALARRSPFYETFLYHLKQRNGV